MPLYDYKCSICGKIFEVEQRISEKPLEKCIFCPGQVKRMITATGIVFKGSGFHVNDYRKDSKIHPASSAPAGSASTKPAAVTSPSPPKKEPPKTSSEKK